MRKWINKWVAGGVALLSGIVLAGDSYWTNPLEMLGALGPFVSIVLGIGLIGYSIMAFME